MNVLSLFDGISVAQQALKELGVKDITYFASEIDKYAISLTLKNHPDTIQVGCVTNIGEKKETTIRYDIDLLIGGSPCQDLSIAKKNRNGLAGARSGLFYEYVRILKEIKPKYFVLENVNSMPKEAKQQITEILGVEPIMINAALVSAQNRKRLFWTNIPGVTQPEDRMIFLKDILEENVDPKYITKMNFEKRFDYTLHENPYDKKSQALRATDYKGTHNMIVADKNGLEKLKSNTIRTSGKGSGIDDKHNWDSIRIGEFNQGGQGDRIYSQDGKSVTLSANGGGRGAKTGLYAIAVAQRGRNIVEGKRKDILGAKTEQRMEFGGEKSNTITTVQKDSYVLQDTQIRKLTPIECERLQSLPDNYTEGISNTQRYKCLGNAFNCEVVKHILKNII